MTAKTVDAGDFDSLAEDYSRYRPGYAPSVLAAVVGLLGRPPAGLDAADLGAGTGIWTRMVAAAGFRSVVAVEPSESMRAAGMRDCAGADSIRWQRGRGDQSGLADGAVDLVSMASSFHWVDFDRGVAEFARILRPGGWFVALWNPRLIEASPLLGEIESQLTVLHPGLHRRSSGRSGRTEGLTERLWTCGRFDDVVALEGRHGVRQSVAQYIGAWRSVNDVQAQLGPEKFARFLDYLGERLRDVESIDTTYLTRAWAARRP